MGAIPKMQLAAWPSLQELRGGKKVQIMLPDDRGILRHHYVKVEMCDQFKTMVSAEEMMQAYHSATSIQTSASLITTPSATTLGSIPSTSSVLLSHGSQFSSGFTR